MVQDYKACNESLDSLLNRIDIYKYKVKADSITLYRSGVVVSKQDAIIDQQNDQIENLEKKKKNRKWWGVGGLILGFIVGVLI